MTPSLAVGIITAPRPVYLLDRTLSSYRTNNPSLPAPRVFEEPGGILRNWVFAAQSLLSEETDFVLIGEDDVFWPKNADTKLFTNLSEHPESVTSLYTSEFNAPEHGRGWSVANLSKSWCGNLALCFPRSVLVEMLDFNFFRTRSNLLDYYIGEILKILQVQIYVHVPTIVLHMGAVHSSMISLYHPSLNARSRRPSI